MSRRYAILALDRFAGDAKTAHGVIRYGTDEVVAVIDPSNARASACATCCRISTATRRSSRASREALQFAPTALLIGTAPKGGGLPPEWRGAMLDAIGARLEIVSGLHDMLERRSRVSRRGCGRPERRFGTCAKPPDVPLFAGDVYDVAAPVVLTVGNDCAVGKMSVSLELVRAASERRKERALRSDRPNRHHDRGVGNFGRSRHRRFRAGRRRTARALRGARRRRSDRRRGARRDQSSGVRAGHARADVRLRPDALVLVCDPRRAHDRRRTPTPALGYARSSIAIHEALLETREAGQRRRHRAQHARTQPDERARGDRARARAKRRFTRRRRRAFRRANVSTRPSLRGSSNVLRCGCDASVIARRRSAALPALLLLALTAVRARRTSRRTASAMRGRFPACCGSAKTKSPTASISCSRTAPPPTRSPACSSRLSCATTHDGNYVPDLADRSADACTTAASAATARRIVVHLRQGVVWADGAPLTAADWLFTYRAVMNPRKQREDALRLGRDRLGERTRSLHDRHSAQAPERRRARHPRDGRRRLSADARAPAREAAESQRGGVQRAAALERPVLAASVEPRFVARSSCRTRATFAARRNSKKSIWKVVPDVNTLFNQLATHEIDVYPSVNANAIARLSSIAGINVDKQPDRQLAPPRHQHLSRPLLHDVRVRRAIAEAVDWKRINDTVFHGINRLAVSDIFPESWAAPALPPYRYDPAGARRLLGAGRLDARPDGVLHKGPHAMHLDDLRDDRAQENTNRRCSFSRCCAPFGIDLADPQLSRQLPLREERPALHRQVRSRVVDRNQRPRSRQLRGVGTAPSFRPTARTRRGSTIRSSTRRARPRRATFDEAERKRLYQREEERIRELVPAVFFSWRNELHRDEHRRQELHSGRLHRRHLERVGVAASERSCFRPGARRATRRRGSSSNPPAPASELEHARAERLHRVPAAARAHSGPRWLDLAQWRPGGAKSFSPQHEGVARRRRRHPRRPSRSTASRSARADVRLQARRVLVAGAFASLASVRARRAHSRRSRALAIRGTMPASAAGAARQAWR